MSGKNGAVLSEASRAEIPRSVVSGDVPSVGLPSGDREELISAGPAEIHELLEKARRPRSVADDAGLKTRTSGDGAAVTADRSTAQDLSTELSTAQAQEQAKESPSLGSKALEYLGQTGGAAFGAAVGIGLGLLAANYFGFSPWIGAAVGAAICGFGGYKIMDMILEPGHVLKSLFETAGGIGGVLGLVGGGIGGAVGGAAVGTSVSPGIGTAIGAVAGGLGGGYLGNKLPRWAGDALGWLADKATGLIGL